MLPSDDPNTEQLEYKAPHFQNTGYKGKLRLAAFNERRL
jgi:hypothetical protein